MFIDVSATGQGEGAEPGFFHGPYGGPRITKVLQENIPNYNFLKTHDGGDTASFGGERSDRPRSAEEELLEGCLNHAEQTGKRVQIILRDERIIVGELASVDHFNNLVVRDAVERIVVGKEYGDIVRGIFIVRGDNVMLVGEIDTQREIEMERVLQQVPVDEALHAHKEAKDRENAKKAEYKKALEQRGVAFPRPLEDEF